MDIITNFLQAYSYKFPKGYPDLTDPKDVLILESIISEIVGEDKFQIEWEDDDDADYNVLSNDVFDSQQQAKEYADNCEVEYDGMRINPDTGDDEYYTINNYYNQDDKQHYNSYKVVPMKISINESQNPTAQECVNILKQTFGLNDDDFIFSSSKTFKLLVSKELGMGRQQLLNKIIELPDFEFEGEGGSSIGRIKYKNQITIYLKPKEVQGDLSHGKENESIVIDNINNAIKEAGKPITVIFKSPTRTLTYDNVAECVDSSKTGAIGYAKSDVKLISSSNKTLANVSIKKASSFRWESSKRRYKAVFDNFVTKAQSKHFPNLELVPDPQLKGKYLMMNTLNNKPYSKIIINNFPHDEMEDVVFGNEDPKPIIVGRNFTQSDFTNNKELIIIQASHIYIDIDEIIKDNKAPVMLFMKHSGKQYGIDFRALPKDLTKYGERANVLEINYDDIMS